MTVAGGTFKPTLRPLAAGTGGPSGTASCAQTNLALNGVGGERPVLQLTGGATSVIGTPVDVLVGTAEAKAGLNGTAGAKGGFGVSGVGTAVTMARATLYVGGGNGTPGGTYAASAGNAFNSGGGKALPAMRPSATPAAPVC